MTSVLCDSSMNLVDCSYSSNARTAIIDKIRGTRIISILQNMIANTFFIRFRLVDMTKFSLFFIYFCVTITYNIAQILFITYFISFYIVHSINYYLYIYKIPFKCANTYVYIRLHKIPYVRLSTRSDNV